MGIVEELESPSVGECSRRTPSRRLLALGVHPVTLLPLLDADGGQRRCGECDQVYVRRCGERTFTKCARAGGRRRGPNVPADLPACAGYAPRGEGPDPYAALAPGVPAPHRAPSPGA